jgi:hypothetical protein
MDDAQKPGIHDAGRRYCARSGSFEASELVRYLVEPSEPFRDDRWFLGSFNFNRYEARDRIFRDLFRGESCADFRFSADWRYKTQLIKTVVDAHFEIAAHVHGFARQLRKQRYRKESMRDGAAKRRLPFGALNVYVNPLRVAGQLGELVDHFLRHRQPIADTHFLAGQ